MKNFLFALVIVSGLTTTTQAQVGCDAMNLIVNVGSVTDMVNIYHPGHYLTWPQSENVIVWEITDMMGNMIAEDTLVDEAFFQSNHNIPITDTMIVTALLTNDAVGIACLIEDQLYWEVTEGWQFLHGNVGVDVTNSTFQTTHVVENEGFTFTPSPLTIQEGDEVNFAIAGNHNVIEFSEEDFNSQTQNPLPDGFQLGFGGGLVTSDLLTVGTHYYYCAPHFALDMFGIIIVEPSQGCDGDFDGDLDVDVTDFLSLNSAFGTTCSDCPEDITGDGTVDISDFIQFNSAFGSPCE